MRIWIVAFMGLWLAGCGDTATNAPVSGDIAGLSSDANVSQMYATGQIRMTATASYTQGVPDRNVTEYVNWDSNDTSIVTVSAEGVVSGYSVGGNATITAGYNRFSSVNTIAVIGLERISIDANETNVSVEQTIQLTAAGTFEDNATFDVTQGVTWSITAPDDSNASIEQNGTLYTGDLNGTLDINVTRYDVNASLTLSIAP